MADAPKNEPADAASEWATALGDPAVRTSLLQFGLNLMTPMGFGQTPAGHIAGGVGAAGEALTRGRAEDRAQQEADTKSTLREAQATLAGSRAAHAGESSARQGDRLQYLYEKMNLADTIRQQQQRLNTVRAYDVYYDKASKLHNALVNPGPVPLTREEWEAAAGVGGGAPAAPTATLDGVKVLRQVR